MSKNFTNDELSIALMALPQLFRSYLDFRKSNTLTDCYTADTAHALAIAAAMTSPGSGFLWNHHEMFAQHPLIVPRLPTHAHDEYGNALPFQGVEFQWKRLCKEAHQTYVKFLRHLELKGKIKLSRDPSLPIAAILCQPRPWLVLYILEERMWAEPFPESWSDVQVAFEYGKRLFVSLLIRYPFRMGTFERWQITHLRHGLDSIEIQLPAPCFKNSRFLANQSFITPLDPRVYPKMIEYLNIHRPRLAPAGSDHLFFCCPTKAYPVPGRKKLKGRYSTDFRAIVQASLRDFAPGGFQAHAVRDIVATDIIMNDPDFEHGCMVAAVTLWENVKSVRKHYLKIRDQGLLKEHSRLLNQNNNQFAGQHVMTNSAVLLDQFYKKGLLK